MHFLRHNSHIKFYVYLFVNSAVFFICSDIMDLSRTMTLCKKINPGVCVHYLVTEPHIGKEVKKFSCYAGAVAV